MKPGFYLVEKLLRSCRLSKENAASEDCRARDREEGPKKATAHGRPGAEETIATERYSQPHWPLRIMVSVVRADGPFQNAAA